jgi:hypothetical protein
MTTQKSDPTTLMGRVEKLEQQNCWMKRAGVAILLLVGSAVLMGSQGQPQDKTAEPEKLVLRDAKGNERAWLGMDKDGPALRFRDEAGKERLWLGVLQNTPGLVFYDDQGKRRASLSTSKSTVSLILYDRTEKRQVWLVMSDEAAALHLLGGKDGRHAALSVEEKGVAVWHHDKDGKIHAGENGLQSVPGLSLHGKVEDLLFPKRE